MIDIIIRNYEGTKEEILIDYDKDSFFENWQQNETWEVCFSVSRTQNNEITFGLIDYESKVIVNGQEFVIKGMVQAANGEKVTIDVTATHIYYTIQDQRQYKEITGTRSINQLLTHVFSSGNENHFIWEVIDPNNLFTTVQQENFGNANYLNLIEEIIKDYDAVVIPNNKKLTFYPREGYGKKIEQQIRYKYNTDNVIFDIDTYSFRTQIRGIGKKKEDGSEYFPPVTYTSPQAEIWGIRIQDPVEDERYTIVGNMKDRLKRELQDYPAVSGTTTLKWKISPNKGDYVPFIYEPLNIRTYIQVVGLKTYHALPNKPPEIALSNTKKTMTSILTQLSKKGVV
ncbi:phage tail protein [Enterococcus sp. AZ007]|uniref:phage tail protein n=1 Tax=Enterococcus sp. AZ007 TaxID=2774839 RepID=UPI003F257301